MSKDKFRFEDELLKLIRKYNDPLVILTPELKKEVEGKFYEFVLANAYYFYGIFSSFTDSVKTIPYDFNKEYDKQMFIKDTINEKLYPEESETLNIIKHLDTEKNIKTYLYRCMANAVLTLIKANNTLKRKPGNGLKTIDDGVIQVPAPENKENRATNFEKEFPLLFEEEEMKAYRHLFMCSNLFNVSVTQYARVESNTDERILNWRNG